MYESMVGHRGGNLYRCMDLPFDTVLICGNKQLVVIVEINTEQGRIFLYLWKTIIKPAHGAGVDILLKALLYSSKA